MPALKLEQFGGELPAWDQRLLPPGQAARSLNGYLFSGALKGWRKPKVLRQLTNPNAKMAFRLPRLSEQQALAYLVFKTQPQQDDAVIIGDTSYLFKTSIGAVTDQPGWVLIGVNVTDTVTNLIAAITADGGTNGNAGILYSENTIANGDVKWYRDDQDPADGLAGPGLGLVNLSGTNYTFLQVGSPDFGAAFNLTEVQESTGRVRMTWLADLNDFADTATTFMGGTNATFDNSVTGSSTWLEFNDADTNVLKSSVVDDKWQRYYTASPSQPPKYNPYDRILDGLPFWLLGVPAPGCAPLVAVSGGGNDLQLGQPVSGGGEFVGPGNAVFLLPVKTPGATTILDINFTASPNQSFQPTDSFFTAFLAGDVKDGHFAAVIYQDEGGKPGGLLATGLVVTGISASNLNTSTFQNPVSLEGDTTYWIGFMVDSAFKYQATFGGTTIMRGFINTFSNGPPERAPTNEVSSGIWPAISLNESNIVTDLITISMYSNCVTADLITARAYVYTWVSAYDEEGPPSPPSLLNGWSNGTWSIDLWTPPDNDRGVLRNLTGINIYRTIPGSGGTTTFFKVANVPIGTAGYADTIPDSIVALNEQLPSTNWFPPPENLQGIIAMPNGVMAGFAENQIWFCDPYHPHAWPPGFVLTTEFPIVGLGLSNGALVACTATVPYVVQGNSPGTMTLTKCGRPNPCSSRGSIISGDDYVTYHSPNGLIQVSPSGVAVNTTDLWFTREQWTSLTPPRYVRAVYLASCYFAYGTTSPATVVPPDNSLAQDGFTIELDQDNQSFTIWPQPGGHRLGFNELDSHTGFNIDNVLTDPWTGIGMLVSNGAIYYYDFGDQGPELTTYTWKSKIYAQNNKKSYEAMKVFFTVPADHDPLNEYRLELPADNAAWQTLAPDRYAVLRTYADFAGNGEMTLIDCREVRKSGELLRIRSGFKAEQWQWEITGNVVISNLQIATSAKELSNV